MNIKLMALLFVYIAFSMSTLHFVFSQEICSEEYRPVCGKNNITFFNECIMGYAGVEKIKDGVCNANENLLLEPPIDTDRLSRETQNQNKPLEEYKSPNFNPSSKLNSNIKQSKTQRISPTSCELYNETNCALFSNCKTHYQKKWIFFRGEFSKCTDSAQSNALLFTKEDLKCPTVIDYVCGEDKVTYPNSCYAQLRGINVAYNNRCEDIKCDEFDENACLNFKTFCKTDYDYQFFYFGKKSFNGCDYRN